MAGNNLLLVNARAGTAARDRVESVRAVLAAHGGADVVFTESTEDCDMALAALDGRRLLVAGGDGSVHVVVSRLRSLGMLDVPVGIVPLGTGNDLARAVGIPLDAEEAARAALAGRPASLDLLVHGEGEIAVNAVHVGVGAEAADEAARWKGFMGTAAYPLAGVVTGLREGGWEVEVDVDGRRVSSGPALVVVVANGPTVGGGTPICPPARPDDGLLDVVVAEAVGPLARAGFAAALQRGRHLDRDDVVHARGRSVEIRGGPLRFDADGEVSHPESRRLYRIDPGAWSVLTAPM